MGKHSDWSGVTEILGRAASELRNEVKGIAQDKSGNVRESLASAVDDIAEKIRTARTPAFAQPTRHSGIGALPILLGLGALIGVAWMARHHQSDAGK
jgi:hypothetical protein